MATLSWAQADDVLAYTGQTVTDAQVTRAQAIIDMFAARTYDALPRIGARDLRWLKLACAYQAAWMLSQPDMFGRLDVAAISTGSRPVELKENALRLAPLARTALNRVSWLRSRSLHVRSRFTDGLTPISPDPDSAGNDAYESWSPI